MRARRLRLRAVSVPFEEVYMAARSLSGEAARLSGQSRSVAAEGRRSLSQVRSAVAHGG